MSLKPFICCALDFLKLHRPDCQMRTPKLLLVRAPAPNGVERTRQRNV